VSGSPFPGRDWDGEVYDRVSDPQFEWGLEVLDRLPLEGHETVLDAGCGTGRVTAVLLERLPRGRVVAVDASPSMLDQARTRLGDAVELHEADLVDLELERPVDAVLSTAVFHWILDHDRLFRRLHAALRPGGRLAVQCGGEGNIASLRSAIDAATEREPFSRHLAGTGRPWNFASPAEATRRLEAAGFEEIECWLEPKPVTPPDARAYLPTVTLGFHLAELPQDLHEPFVDAVLAGMGDPVTLDYVRLNIAARRPPATP